MPRSAPRSAPLPDLCDRISPGWAFSVTQTWRGVHSRLRRRRSIDGVNAGAFSWGDYAGVLFDLDGVITPTAEIHEHAWGELFAAFDYTEADYLAYIDGKPRYDGVRSFLASRGIELPDGLPDDPPGDDTVCAMGNRKNALFNDDPRPRRHRAVPGFDGRLDLLAEIGVPAAIVSSSKNAGRCSAPPARRPIRGRRRRCRRRRRGPGRQAGPRRLSCSAPSGSGRPDAHRRRRRRRLGRRRRRAGGFAVVIGVDRGAGAETLLEHGATSSSATSPNSSRRASADEPTPAPRRPPAHRFPVDPWR